MEKEEKKKSFWKSKMFLFAILPLFVIGSVVAAYFVVSSLTLNVGVGEAFTVQYAILGDGGDYVGTDINADCAAVTTWYDSISPTGNILIGEDRLFCIKITNNAEASVPYVIAETITHPTLLTECEKAFKVDTTVAPYVGTVPARVDTTLGQVIVPVLVAPALDATPVTDCVVKIDVGRGTLS